LSQFSVSTSTSNMSKGSIPSAISRSNTLRFFGSARRGSRFSQEGYQVPDRGNSVSYRRFRSTHQSRSGRWKRGRVRVNTQKANSSLVWCFAFPDPSLCSGRSDRGRAESPNRGSLLQGVAPG
jgi:hypothetical protein